VAGVPMRVADMTPMGEPPKFRSPQCLVGPLAKRLRNHDDSSNRLPLPREVSYFLLKDG
jgi:hypothetical protein